MRRLAALALCALPLAFANSCCFLSEWGEAFERAFAYLFELPHATWSPWAPDSASLLFSSPYDDDGALHLVPIDGSEPRVLARGSFFTPMWSPDGSTIAFGARRAHAGAGPIQEGFGPTELWTMSSDGSNRRCLITSFAFAWFTPVWSPDGSWIAYGKGTIELVRADASERRSLGPGWIPVWSPDGTRIAHGFSAGLPDSPGHTIQITRIDGSSSVRLTSGFAPSWSPDGDRLVFQEFQESDEQVAVFVIDADGSNRRRLCEGLYPRWAPRGDRILVQRIDDTLVTIVPDGSDERVLTENARFGRWSPDGKWIAFQWQSNFHVIRADGAERRALTVETLAPTAEP